MNSVIYPLGKDSFEKEKVVKFHNFGPDPPPPLKVVKPQTFFLLHDQKNIMCKLRKNLPWKPKRIRKSQKFSWKLSKIFKVYWSGDTPTPLKIFQSRKWL